MELLGIEIFACPESRTGLSALSGETIRSLDDLPAWRTEVHVFRSSSEAEAFVAGLEAAGMGNSIAYDWPPGSLASNRTVILAHLDSARSDAGSPEDAVVAVDHKPSPHDGAALAASHERALLERQQWVEEAAIDAAPIRKALHGSKSEDWGVGWWRGSVGGIGLNVRWKSNEGPFNLLAGCDDLFSGAIGLDDLLRDAVTQAGACLDVEDRAVVAEAGNLENLPKTVGLLSAAISAAEVAKATALHERFVSETRMNAARRRFIEAAASSGFVSFVKRGTRKLRAGTVEIGPSEIYVMERIGWIVKGEVGYSVTDEGLAVARAPREKRICRRS